MANDPRAAAEEPCLAVIRELVRAYQAFIAGDSDEVRAHGLTTAQFDVLATLGNTPGMHLTQLAQRTLITKSALTGVIDRLEAKGILERRGKAGDRRCFIAALTPAGEALFAEVFPERVQRVKAMLAHIPESRQTEIVAALAELRAAFAAAGAPPDAAEQSCRESTPEE